MKSLTRLTVLVVVLLGLALATGVAYAGQLNEGLGNMWERMQGSSPEALLDSYVEPKITILDDGDVQIIGQVTSITTDTLVVSEVVIAINADTTFEDEVVVGDIVVVRAYYAEDETLTARTVALFEDDYDEEYIVFVGEVTEITTDTLTVSDVVIAINDETEFEDEVVVGDMVKVKAFFDENDVLTAYKVELVGDDDDEEVTIIGEVTSITTDTLVVSDTVIAITPETVFEDEVVVGDMVRVKAYYADDGTLIALRVELYEEDDDDGNPGFGYDVKVFIVGVVDSFSSDSIVVAGVPISVTEQTKIQGIIEVGDTVRVHAYLSEDGTLTAWKIKELPDSVSNPGKGDKMMVIGGIVDELNADSIVVSGIWLPITDETEFDGDIGVGDRVKVTATTEGGTVTVLKVKLIGDADGWDDEEDRGDDDPRNREDGKESNPGGGNDKDKDKDKDKDANQGNDKVKDNQKDKDKDKVKDNKKDKNK